MHEAARAIRDDTSSGAAALSLQALDALRDVAVGANDSGDGSAAVVAVARDLRDARPAMTSVANRVNRAMATAETLDPGAVAAAADQVRSDAADADRAAARQAAALLGDRVLTLSRSGTAIETVQTAAPERVFVAESRPAREGVGVAEELSDAHAVTLLTDAAIPSAIVEHDVDAVVTGADTVAPDGCVLNKTGTRVAALAAAHAGVPHLVVAARDKVAPAGHDLEGERGDPAAIYDGDADLEVYAPTFDVTPADLVTLVTEDGPQPTDAVAAIAVEHREHAGWAEGSEARSGLPSEHRSE